MYSVFLVEDEYVIREGIKNLVDWETLGFEFVGEAADGELAWPMIQKKRPDIVITDIKMPFIDGLEMSRMIKKAYPNTVIIILSGYDEFEYAREAIKIGVNQYLLKPLSKNQLIEILVEIKKQKDDEEANRYYHQQFNQEVQEYLSSSRRGLFDLITANEMPIHKVLDRANTLGIDLVAERYNLVMFYLEENLLEAQYTKSIAEVQEKLNKHCTNNPHQILLVLGLRCMSF